MSLRTELGRAFPELTEKGIFRFDEPLNEHCSFRIGGPAEAFCTPDSVTQITNILGFAIDNNIQYFILGCGSNLLISDKGISGLVIQTKGLNRISHDEDCVSAWCGAKLKDLCDYARDQGLAGLEFAAGIPGSVGGAVYMNAGAYGGEIKDALYCSKYLSLEQGAGPQASQILHLKAGDHAFAYRRSVFQQKKFIHLSSVFRLRRDDSRAIDERMRELEEQRWAKQPMDLPSGGSVFKRPEGHFTGKLIDDCGLRGFQIGGAAVSDKHCGFIVNMGGATADDVMAVIRHVQSAVWERYNVRLELELRIVGNL